MHILPHSKQELVGAVLFPLKAYVVIAPVMFFVSRIWPTDADQIFVISLLCDSFILLAAALVLRIRGPRGYSLSAAGFGFAALVVTYLALLPLLAATRTAWFR